MSCFEKKILPSAFAGLVISAAPQSGIAAERRAQKYLADVYSSSGNSLYPARYRARFLDPIKPALILPEFTDTITTTKMLRRARPRSAA